MANFPKTTDVETPLDMDALMKRCLGRIDLVERVLDRFETAFADELAKLESALQDEDFDEVGAIAHRIKGTSLTVSANVLSRQAGELESLAPSGDAMQLGEGYHAIEQEWRRVRDALPLASSKANE